MPALIRNDATQTVASADRATESAQQFLNATTQFANLTAGGTGLEGASQIALAQGGERVRAAGQKVHSTVQPRIDAIRQSAAASMAVGDEGASALNGIPASF